MQAMAEQTTADELFSRLVYEVLAPMRTANAPPEEQVSWQNRYCAAFAADKELLPKLNKEILAAYPKIRASDLNQLYIFAKNLGASTLVAERSEEPDANLSAITLALKPAVDSGGSVQLRHIQADFSFADVKRLIQETATLDFQARANCRLPFFISRETEIDGCIISSMYKGLKNMKLFQATSDSTGIHFNYFDEPIEHAPGNRRNVAGKLEFFWPFHCYKFLADSGEEFVLFSDKQLDLGRFKVAGMRALIADATPFGDTSRLVSIRRCLFVYSVETDVRDLSDAEAREVADKFADYEALMFNVRGGYPHPRWFERFMAAFLLSGKDSGYPLHLGWISPTGGGKSDLVQCFHSSLGEMSKIEGGGTIKGLVPHFGGPVPDEGFLVKAHRVAIVDEFFARIASMRSKSNSTEDGTFHMLTILEHQPDQYSAGNTSVPLTVQMTARAVFISNVGDYYGFNNMADICQKVSTPFLARVLWYFTTDAHYDFIQANKTRIAGLERAKGPLAKDQNLMPPLNQDFINLYDYLSARMLQVDPDRVQSFVKKTEQLVPAEALPVYKSRCHHSLALIVDGIAKLNWVIERREKLEVLEADYGEAEAIFETIILSWAPQAVLSSSLVTPGSKLNYLPLLSRSVFDFLREHMGASISEIEAAFPKSTVIKAIVQELINYGIVLMERDEAMVWHYKPYYCAVSTVS